MWNEDERNGKPLRRKAARRAGPVQIRPACDFGRHPATHPAGPVGRRGGGACGCGGRSERLQSAGNGGEAGKDPFQD
ncbi:hypothetical protein SDC9_149405 [bioreactor metagenome]|uniref:Uncharacterized protein n=1 Tax=bioreactor metagenome TaxID=1076179 RepID=A0A645EJN6_9ZZZZ